METLAANTSAWQACELVLPNIESMRPSDLKSLVNVGTISSLHLGKTPHIRLAAVMKLIAASSITLFTHPALYSRCFDLTIGTQWARLEKSWSNIFPCGDGTNFPLRQVVYVTTAFLESDIPRLRGGGLDWAKFKTASPTPGATAIATPMEDALMAPARLMKFAPMALGRLVTMEEYDLNSLSGKSRIVNCICEAVSLDQEQLRHLCPWNDAGHMDESWVQQCGAQP